MVGQSVMCATVIVSFLVGPSHSWGALLGEGSPSFKSSSDLLDGSSEL